MRCCCRCWARAASPIRAGPPCASTIGVGTWPSIGPGNILQSRSGRRYPMTRLLSCFAVAVASCTAILVATNTGRAQIPNHEHATVLDNGVLQVDLRVSDSGIPYIDTCRFQEGGKLAFAHAGPRLGLKEWLPQTLDAPDMAATAGCWRLQDDDIAIRASFTRQSDGLEATWVVELVRNTPLMRVYVHLANRGERDISLDCYPAWMARWAMPGENASLKYWDALTYEPHRIELAEVPSAHLQSRVYSSDRQGTAAGNVPYWQIRNSQGVIYFGIEWCGGWSADIRQVPDGASLRVLLPESETQLVLHPGEKITGPAVHVMPFPGTDEPQARQMWLRSLGQWARRTYGDRPLEYPFIYNHWYSAGRDLSREFLVHQLQALQPYGFDVFVLDDGWFEEVGRWTPAQAKFKPGELEGVFALIREKGIQAGIWSCPWLVHAEPNDLPPEVDRPPFLRTYMKAYALDLAGYDFTRRLLDHIRNLRSQFGIDWWKYDQELFGETSRHGRMKNVVALQEALAAVRSACPDLAIENCMSGGRMINVFTDSIARIHWIRDGGQTGYAHARSNVQEALGAVDFLGPAKVQRWSNRPNEVTDEEVLRCYCRSAMIGVWGISANLHKITDAQKQIIQQEAQHYRRLNQYKNSLLYETLLPEENRAVTGVVYYAPGRTEAAVLLFRWHALGTFTHRLKLQYLTPGPAYAAAAAGAQKESELEISPEHELSVRFSEGQLSALGFVQPRDQ
ncbi:hypothetical protein GF356_08600 [candidate division GN15 bacterium]|nr:hypothetical protein [candidate division GN15 bacterium]